MPLTLDGDMISFLTSEPTIRLADTAPPAEVELALRRLYAQRERARANYHANIEARRAKQLAWYHDPVRHEERKAKNREAMRIRNAAKKAAQGENPVASS